MPSSRGSTDAHRLTSGLHPFDGSALYKGKDQSDPPTAPRVNDNVTYRAFSRDGKGVIARETPDNREPGPLREPVAGLTCEKIFAMLSGSAPSLPHFSPCLTSLPASLLSLRHFSACVTSLPASLLFRTAFVARFAGPGRVQSFFQPCQPLVERCKHRSR